MIKSKKKQSRVKKNIGDNKNKNARTDMQKSGINNTKKEKNSNT